MSRLRAIFGIIWGRSVIYRGRFDYVIFPSTERQMVIECHFGNSPAGPATYEMHVGNLGGS